MFQISSDEGQVSVRDVFIPVMGMAPDDVVLTSWTKSSGESVRAGDVIAVIETSKAELEVTAEVDGVLGRQLFAEGDTLPPGTTIGSVLEADETDTSSATAPSYADPGGQAPVTAVVDGATGPNALTPSTASVVFDGGTGTHARGASFPLTAVVDGADGQAAPDSGAAAPELPRHAISPRARRLTAEAAARPTQPGNEPLEPPAAVRPPPPPPVRHPALAATTAGDQTHLSGQDRYRAAISAAVSRSWREIPHFAVTRELRVGAVIEAVDQWRTVLPGLTLTDLLVRALALAMMERERRTELAVGLAVATDRGVAIPVLRDVLGLGMVELVDARRAAVSRARDGRLHPDDAVMPATTLSNLGAIGVDQFTGVIPYGQTSMLTVGRAADRPVVTDGALAVARTMQATLNVDHRSWDGSHAGQALDRLARLLAAPAPLLTPSAPGRQRSEEDSA